VYERTVYIKIVSTIYIRAFWQVSLLKEHGMVWYA